MYNLTLLSVLLIVACFNTALASPWQISAKGELNLPERTAVAQAVYFRLDDTWLDALLAQPMQTMPIQLLAPDGKVIHFLLQPTDVLSPSLSQKFPQLMTYTAFDPEHPSNIGRFSISPQGFFGFYRYHQQWVLLSPQYTKRSPYYLSYDYHTEPVAEELLRTTGKQIDSFNLPERHVALQQKAASTGNEVRTYRLAVSTTGEYAQKFAGDKTAVVAEIMTLVNRINLVLLSDLAIQFQLVDNEAVIFTDASTDPYTNTDVASDLESNQTTLDTVLGSANYDIGHLLSTNDGGLAAVSGICRGRNKALGSSGLSNPKGERFYIDLVAHELGHQLGASHSFNAQDNNVCSADQREPQSAVEPGSGSTIMAYAGLCAGQNLQSISDPFFHASSIAEIRANLDSAFNQNCGSPSQIANSAPVISLRATAYSVPANTPLWLQGSASDAEGDDVVFNWEQVDPGGTLGGTANGTEARMDNGFNPLFRSFVSSNVAERFLPRLNNILTQQVNLGETLPSTTRTLTMRLSARDNKGGVESQDVSISVLSDAPPFVITAPAGAQTWSGNSTQRIEWAVGATAQAPIACAKVDILFSSAPTAVFDLVLLEATDNDGQAEIQVPNIATTAGRIMAKCSDNVFLAVNQDNLIITLSDPIVPVITSQRSLSFAEDSQIEITLADLVVEDPDSVYPDDFSLQLLTGDNYALDGAVVTSTADFNGELIVGVVVNDGLADSDVFNLRISVTAVNDAPIAVDDSVTVAQNAPASLIAVLANDSDVDQDSLSIIALEYSGSGSVTINNQQLSYQSATGFSGRDTVRYTISDGQLSSVATLTITVTPAPVTSPPSNNGGGGGAVLPLLLFALISLSIKLHAQAFKEYNA
jgi:hypothetical protein